MADKREKGNTYQAVSSDGNQSISVTITNVWARKEVGAACFWGRVEGYKETTYIYWSAHERRYNCYLSEEDSTNGVFGKFYFPRHTIN
jgi:hypothetical protein